MNKYLHALTDPGYLALGVLHKFSRHISNDELYIKLAYFFTFGKRLNLKNPKTFNEKQNWLKLYDRKPIYSVMADKVKAKDYVANIIGNEYIIPTLGVWDSPNDIDFDQLPDQFVLKCNHNSGKGMYICSDKSKMDVEKVKEELEAGLQQDFFINNREWPYKNIPRKVLAEKFMSDGSAKGLLDYKFFCFNGKPEIMFIADDLSEHPHTDFFDMNFNRLEMKMHDPNSPKDKVISKPKTFEKMKDFAALLSKGIPFLRVDFYEIDGHLYFGELTFYHHGGLGELHPDEYKIILGDKIILPSKTV